MSKNRVNVVIGPTASGKSAHALSIQNAVIINCDAMQSYDALHRLTAQPDNDERADVPHCLYGFLHPNTH
jgi:tRNA dimethylallyltransferase